MKITISKTFARTACICISFIFHYVAFAQKLKQPDELVIPFGNGNKIVYNMKGGTYSIIFKGNKMIRNAYAVCRDSDSSDSRQYTQCEYTARAVNTSFGKGTLYTIVHPGQLKLQQLFYVFPGKDYFVTELNASGEKAACNYMAPLVADNFSINENGDNRLLSVPYDNDMWVRYNASKIAEANFISSEVTALYNNDNYHGIVIGSLEQNTWKSGVHVKGNSDKSLSSISVYAGFTDTTITHDRIAHGAVLPINGVCRSPKIMVGSFDDWRTGMETYAKLKATVEPRFIFKWTLPTPMGWNSWGAIQTKIDLRKAKSVIDFFADSCKGFRNGENTLYIDLDAFWDNMTPSGLDGDVSQLRSFVEYCKQKGFKPGIYWTPFADWGKNKRKIEGSSHGYEETWTMQNGKTLDIDGGRAMDPTHPGTRDRIVFCITRLKELGFEMIKIDFLVHGAMEADKFYDPTVTTGMQAFKKGMEFLDSVLNGKMLVYAAISPNIATARYVHSRRIACDAFSAIDNTEYTLNGTGYGWWQSGIYNYVDADHVVFTNAPDNVNRARLTASIITGTLIAGDDYSAEGKWKVTAQKLLQNQELLSIVKQGKSFRPIDANTDNHGVNTFIQKINGQTYIAALNYSNEEHEFTIPLNRIALNNNRSKHAYLLELFSGNKMVLNGDTLHIKVGSSDAVIYKFLE